VVCRALGIAHDEDGPTEIFDVFWGSGALEDRFLRGRDLDYDDRVLEKAGP
jgi:hypothetical protein